MRKISVIIPFFQRTPGVLGRTLRSVAAQVMPDGWQLEVVIVDDGSPVDALQELIDAGLGTTQIFRIINQQNSGVGAARNRGLDTITRATELVAFLDSDDIWPADHLARAISAMEKGFDFYFADNRRQGMHESQVSLCFGTRDHILASPQSDGLVALSVDRMVGFCLTEFPCQASTVVFRCAVAPALRFNTTLRSSGEDVLYFSELLSKCQRVCFDEQSAIECGEGVNIYFGHLDWNSARFLAIEVDKVLTYRFLDQVNFLSAVNRKLNKNQLNAQIAKLGFHFFRSLIFKPRTSVRQFRRLLSLDSRVAKLVLLATPRAVLVRVFGQGGVEGYVS